MVEITTLTKATSKSDSLRTTIPKSIVRQFELKQGDKIQWKMEVAEGKLLIKIEPISKIT